MFERCPHEVGYRGSGFRRKNKKNIVWEQYTSIKWESPLAETQHRSLHNCVSKSICRRRALPRLQVAAPRVLSDFSFFGLSRPKGYSVFVSKPSQVTFVYYIDLNECAFVIACSVLQPLTLCLVSVIWKNYWLLPEYWVFFVLKKKLH